MKRIVIISCLIAVCSTAFGQQYKKTVQEIKVKDQISLLGSIDSLITKKASNYLIRFFVVSNGSGSAHIAGGDEITNNILICIAEYDEEPLFRIFSVGPFYMPKFIDNGTDFKDKYRIIIEHGEAAKRQKSTLSIYVDKVVIE